MPISEAKAEIIADEYLKGKSYTDIGLSAGYKPSPHIRTTIYDTLQSPTVQSLIAEKSAKIHSIDELQALTSKSIDKITSFVDKTDLTLDNANKVSKYLEKQKDFIELQGKFQSAFVQKSVNLTVVAQLQADQSKPLSTQQLIDAITNTIRQPEQGRGEANIGDKI